MNKFLAVTIALSPLLIFSPAKAQDASLGCKILLCAAASNPSWESIPYCVPPMNTLFNILSKGGSWPTCPEGNASGVGYQQYQACPSGKSSYSVTQTATNGITGVVADPNGAICAGQVVQQCSYVQTKGNTEEVCTNQALDATDRPINAKPYYVDIQNNGSSQRFWFNLQ